MRTDASYYGSSYSGYYGNNYGTNYGGYGGAYNGAHNGAYGGPYGAYNGAYNGAYGSYSAYGAYGAQFLTRTWPCNRERPGHKDYCDDKNCGPCYHGEGGCEKNSECITGLICQEQPGMYDDDKNKTIGVCLAPAGGYPQSYQTPYQQQYQGQNGWPYQQSGGECRAVCALLYRICSGDSPQQECEFRCGGRAQTGDLNCIQNAEDCTKAEACVNGIFY